MAHDPFTQQRIDWCEQGHAVLANRRRDGALIAWATQTSRLTWIDRTGRWGNPFVLRKGATPAERERVVQQHAHWFQQHPEFQAALPELAGQVLLCHCAPLACHGETYLHWLDPAHAARYREACAAHL